MKYLFPGRTRKTKVVAIGHDQRIIRVDGCDLLQQCVRHGDSWVTQRVAKKDDRRILKRLGHVLPLLLCLFLSGCESPQEHAPEIADTSAYDVVEPTPAPNVTYASPDESFFADGKPRVEQTAYKENIKHLEQSVNDHERLGNILLAAVIFLLFVVFVLLFGIRYVHRLHNHP